MQSFITKILPIAFGRHYRIVMPNYRRAFIPGGMFFFTLVTHERQDLFADPVARRLLGDCFRQCADQWPFQTQAIVLLPDHLHAIWSLPSGDAQFARRWGWIKKSFTQRWLARGGNDQKVSPGKSRERRRGIWQPRYWEHVIRDEEDFARHFDYIHFNPVKHGLVHCPHEWPASSFHRWVECKVYDLHWACGSQLCFQDIESTVGE